MLQSNEEQCLRVEDDDLKLYYSDEAALIDAVQDSC